jgi:hypothetical protein
VSDKSNSGPVDHRPSADDVRLVLEAEAAVKAKIDRVRDELAESIAAEQARAHRIDQRTSERLSRLHAHCDEMLDRQTEALRAGAELPQIQPDEADRKRLRDAVAELAARLTGAANG